MYNTECHCTAERFASKYCNNSVQLELVHNDGVCIFAESCLALRCRALKCERVCVPVRRKKLFRAKSPLMESCHSTSSALQLYPNLFLHY